jgi:hypothetical protein
VATDCSAAGLFTHRAFQFSMNSADFHFRSELFLTLFNLISNLQKPCNAQNFNLSVENHPFRRRKNVIEDYFSFNPIRLMYSAAFNRFVRKNEYS